MLTALTAFLKGEQTKLDSIVAPLQGIIEKLDNFITLSVTDNNDDRAIITVADERIKTRSKEIARATEVRNNVSGILGVVA